MGRCIYDIEIIRGETFETDIEVTAEGKAMSLYGKTAIGQIRPKEESEELSAEFACTINTAKSTITISLTSAQTTSLKPGTYSYDIFLVGQNFRKCYIGGKFIVGKRTTIVPEELTVATDENENTGENEPNTGESGNTNGTIGEDEGTDGDGTTNSDIDGDTVD